MKVKYNALPYRMPTRADDGACGYDLYADIKIPMTIRPDGIVKVPTGVSMAIPSGLVGLVCPRSGLAVKHGVTVVNAPGVIDQSYTGVIHAPLINLGQVAYTIEPGDRIAQLVFSVVAMPELVYGELDNTPRGCGGFGSTGR